MSQLYLINVRIEMCMEILYLLHRKAFSIVWKSIEYLYLKPKQINMDILTYHLINQCNLHKLTFLCVWILEANRTLLDKVVRETIIFKCFRQFNKKFKNLTKFKFVTFFWFNQPNVCKGRKLG